MCTDVTTALDRWYCEHSAIRRLWAIEDSLALVVYVALEPSSDGDDSLPIWLANQHSWVDDLRRRTDREVQLQLVASGELDELPLGTFTELSWRDSWDSQGHSSLS